MRSIVIVCGAGASSTFLAHRMNSRARSEGLAFTAQAATRDDYLSCLGAGDVLLVGPQLAADFAQIRTSAENVHAHAALLPPSIFGANGAEEALRTAAGLAANDTNGAE